MMAYVKTAKDLAFERKIQKERSKTNQAKIENEKQKQEILDLNCELQRKDKQIEELEIKNLQLLELTKLSKQELAELLKRTETMNDLSELFSVLPKVNY